IMQCVAGHSDGHRDALPVRLFCPGRSSFLEQRLFMIRVDRHDVLSYALRMLPAASMVAAKTLGYVPQRQRLPEMAWRTSCSEGCGFFAISAAQLITMPGVQKPHCMASCLTN